MTSTSVQKEHMAKNFQCLDETHCGVASQAKPNERAEKAYGEPLPKFS